ncbi:MULTISPECIES: hypothetical protein [unclassified Mesorhizobium]|uniref:hypothetical protein n=1 Tax=unclassified Mesorhizobium TaxID=325217 RepID=UPI000FCB0E73|nr:MULTISPECIES: hypothetical protein [unclassified Mesorhizobium]RUW99930.1 hypothetical protein EOA30_22955 [Mesorhizobium sp. M8A.F.Ca.ET.059.01.1.1]TGR43587.1 hypothetical protein EN842_30815 [bacterium M00.F.Ca.ET.199.01.1.1]TGU99696.1 hypothetical protein EN794_002940 [Mesorhizobium sp. M00.F.Ca.ET.151.01.1.1]TGV54002.1 hypothetical protein EN784_37960 [bacterium M00.F.Ca.ET.141.01.1.1]TGV86741.1 hypothetical protein EN792_014280 [Mesorhizobium sp. M00.F.Ca.ET.149.01.1.1]
MDHHLALPGRFSPKPPNIVIDAPLALSPMGLLVTVTLSQSARVWLPRGFYTLLDNDEYYRHRPDQMGGGWLHPDARDATLRELVLELEPWRRAWQNGRLSSRVHWVGDAQYESALPEREGTALLPRFEGCCAALEARLGDLAGTAAPLDECARDVIALSAALQPESTYILTIAGSAGARPPLCDYLERLAFPATRHPGAIPGWSGPAFWPAAAPIAASGRSAAIVQVVAPVILALPDGWSETDWALEDPADHDETPDDPWRNACALWYELAPVEAAA